MKVQKEQHLPQIQHFQVRVKCTQGGKRFSNPTMKVDSSLNMVSKKQISKKLHYFTQTLISKFRVNVLMGCPCSVQRNKVESDNESKRIQQINKNMFIVQGLIGVGGFGKVWAVTLQQTGKWYAIKEINKVRNAFPRAPTKCIFTQVNNYYIRYVKLIF